MKFHKETLRVLNTKHIFALSILCLQLLSSCAHNFDHRNINSYKGTIEQTLKVKIKNNDDVNHLTVYASINREKRHAVLDGVGKLDKHVFTLEVKNGSYFFKDYVNNKEETGNLKDFDLVPLDEEMLFVKIDKNSAQPIIIDNPSKELYVEIKVIEQVELK
jgi:hypothetical protein